MVAGQQTPTSWSTVPASFINVTLSHKHNGALYELAFMVECMKRGWKVSIPVGEDTRYDAIVDTQKTLSRVQIKYVSKTSRGAYRFKTVYGRGRVRKSYNWRDCDIYAAFIMPLNTWWIIPVDKLETVNLNLSNKYHEYNSAWHLIGNENKYTKKKSSQKTSR
jgi:hypothetical protein